LVLEIVSLFMTDESYKYSSNETTTGAVKNKGIWLKVKLKNTVRYVAIACVLLGFYHFFVFATLGLPASGTWITIVSEIGLMVDLNPRTANFLMAIAGCIYVWFGP